MTGTVLLAPGGTLTLTVAAPTARTAAVVQATATITVAPTPARVVQVTQPGPQGTQGDRGPRGEAGPDSGYVYQQDAQAAVWLVDNPLGRWPNVAVYADNGRRMYPDEVYSTTTDVLTLTFAAARSGTVVLT